MTEEMQQQIFERLEELGWRGKLKGTEYMSFLIGMLLLNEKWPLPSNQDIMCEVEAA